MKYPQFLKPNGTIGFIAPSFGCSQLPYSVCLDEAVRIFNEMGYKTVEGPNTRLSVGIGKSNTPKACGAEVNDFFINHKSDIIISCGGGELMCEDLPYIDFERIAKAEPKWYMGYSDNTNLTALLPTLCDTAAIYGPGAAAFGTHPWHPCLEDAYYLLTGVKSSFSNYDGWEKEKLQCDLKPYEPYNITEPYRQVIAGNPAKAEKFSGRLIGGCMDCLVNLCGTRFDKMREFSENYAEDGIIWFLESCDLNVMAMRRAFWQMDQAGWFNNVKGFIIGRPLHYDDSFDGFTPHEAAAGLLEKYNVPIIMDVDLGHLAPRIPFVSGAFANISAVGNTFKISYEFR